MHIWDVTWLSVLQANGVTAGYNRLPVISDIDIDVAAGSIVSVIGPNGAGKSTLLKALVGRLKPMAGQVKVSGADITGWPTHRIVGKGLGYVPQTNNVFVSLSVRENLEMGAFSYSGDVHAQIDRVLAAFPDLAASPNKKAGNLSGGQRNLLGVARALMSEPRVILVDEPTAGLAPPNARLMWQQLVRIASAGAAVLVVEQNVD